MDKITCPRCGEALGVDEEWVITDRTKIGTTIGGGESIQDDYRHADCTDKNQVQEGSE